MCRQTFQHSGLPSAHAGTVWMLRTFLAFRSRNLVRGAPQQRRLNGCRKLRRLLHSVARLSAIQWPHLTLRWQAADATARMTSATAFGKATMATVSLNSCLRSRLL